MMRTISIAFIIYLLCPVNSYSQGRASFWVFGDSVAIDFSDTTNPTILSLPASVSNSNTEAWASISDSNGSLFFYIDVMHSANSPYDNLYFVRNRTNVFANSDSIYCAQTASQGAMILSIPKKLNEFYLFTLQYHMGKPTVSLYSTIVRMTNDSMGEVVDKNRLLLSCDTPSG